MIDLSFERNDKGQVLFAGDNLKLLEDYVIPLIERNDGWSTGHLTKEKFFSNPEDYRGDIDATLQAHPGAGVHVLVDDQKRPLGLLEYILGHVGDLKRDNVRLALTQLREDIDSPLWEKAIEDGLISKESLQDYFFDLDDQLSGKKIYEYIGVVVRPDLQGTKSGVSDKLYQYMQGGYVLGSTSTPLVLAKRRKLFKTTLFFPLLEQRIESVVDLSCLALTIAYMSSKRDDREFGVESHEFFAKRDKSEYMQLAESLLNAAKIENLDYDRLDYILGFEQSQGFIVSY